MFWKPDLLLSVGERVAEHWSAACEESFSQSPNNSVLVLLVGDNRKFTINIQ